MIEWVTGIIEDLGYVGVAVLSFLETLFPPIPSEVVGPLAGMSVSQGTMSYVGALLASMVGFLLGVLPLYALGRFISERRLRDWADRFGRWLGLSGADIDKGCEWFSRHGGKVVVISHLAPGVRSAISVPAGLAAMNVFKFLLYTAIGKGIWMALMIYLGTVLGENFEQISRFLEPITTVVIGLLIAAGIYFVVRRRRESSSSSA